MNFSDCTVHLQLGQVFTKYMGMEIDIKFGNLAIDNHNVIRYNFIDIQYIYNDIR